MDLVHAAFVLTRHVGDLDQGTAPLSTDSLPALYRLVTEGGQEPRKAEAAPADQIILPYEGERNRGPTTSEDPLGAKRPGVYPARIVLHTDSNPSPDKTRPIWLTAGAGLVAFGVALVLALRANEPVPKLTTLTAGPNITSRAMIARSLVAELTHRGIETELVETANTLDELDAVQAREIDFAMVSSVLEIHHLYPELREVSPLFVEAFHLLVKNEHAAAFEDGTLDGLRGLRVDLGPPRSANALLTEEVLQFAKIPCTPTPGPATCGAERVELARLVELASRGDRNALPDAIFQLGSVPSRLALELIRNHAYTLIPLPFANAFRLGGLISDEDGNAVSAAVERRSTVEYILPPYIYGTSPPIPAAPLPTIGARLVLVAHRDLSPKLVEGVVETVLESRFARVPDPALKRSLLKGPPQMPLHAGTMAYLARERPIIAASDVDQLANGLSVLGALVGGGLFAWQAWRQRSRSARDAIFSGFQLEIAGIERRIAELELAAQLELEPLVELQHALLRLKSDALTRFSSGELGDQASLSDLLSPLNSARDHIGNLLLHVRENLEDQALRQGRSAESVWEEAIETSETDPDPS